MIDISHLNFTTDDTHQIILKDVSLKIQKGERIGIIGNSGSGKTTLGMHCAGLHRRGLFGTGKGSLLINGEQCIDRDKRGFAGVVLQNPVTQLFCKTIIDELMLGPLNRGDDAASAKEKAEELICSMGLDPFRNTPIDSLSHGIKQRISIASMLAIDPQVLFLDEPTNYLDPESASALMEILTDINEKQGITIIIVEHNLKLLKPWATRIIEIEDGIIIGDGTPDKIIGEIPFESSMASKGYSKNEKLLSITDIFYGYSGQQNLFNGLNFDFYAGEIVAMTGKNGSGKTTLLKLLKGLFKPGKGMIHRNDGQSLMQSVGIVFQNPDEQIFAHSVLEECAFVLKNKGIPSAESQSQVLQVLEELHISHLAERMPLSLSYGEKRRLTIASILVGGYDVFCFDEPTVALDVENLEVLRHCFIDLAQKGKSVIFSTHDIDFAASVAERVITIDAGSISSIEGWDDEKIMA